MNRPEGPVTSRLYAALDFASRGFSVLPLKESTKIPAISNWQERASTEISEIEDWFKEFPNCNYGLLMGRGCCVLDIDVKSEKNGFAYLKSRCTESLPDNTLVVRTPTGGKHYYFRNQRPLKTVHLPDGLDFISAGGYVVGPGSIVAGGTYSVLTNVDNVEGIPLWILDVFFDKRPDKEDSEGFEPPVELARLFFQTDEREGQNESLSRLLRPINPDLPHNDWLEVLYAGLNVFGTSSGVIANLRSWSMCGEKYSEEEFRKKIESYDAARVEKVGLPRLRKIASSYPACSGWLPSATGGKELADRVLAQAVAILNKNGNLPSDGHLIGLQAVCDGLGHGVYEPKERFRIAFPLETGMGKTTCVVALAAELQHTNKSLLIAAERIEQLKELRDDMIREGVASEKVQIFHRSKDKYADIESVALEDIPKVQFLLVSHSRVRNDSQRFAAEQLLRFGEGTRDLAIWDESLITTSASCVARELLVRAANDWHTTFEFRRSKGRKSKNRQHLYEEFDEFLLKTIDAIGQAETVVDIPTLCGERLDYEQIIRSISDDSQAGFADALTTLVSFSGNGQCRILTARGSDALIQFRQVVDDELNQMIVLDASARIRDLVTYDGSVQVYPLKISKDYSTVVLRHANVRSSKTSFEEDKTHLENYILEIDSLLQDQVPKQESLLVICHKQNKERLLKWKDTHPGRLIHILNWGEHRASNKYSNAKYMVTVGMQYRDHKELAANIVGQTRNLKYPLVDFDIRQVEISEQADALYQAISRGHCRRTSGGRAGEQIVYLFHPDKDAGPVFDLLEEIMPGIRCETYEPRYLKRRSRSNATSYRDLGNSFVEYLAGLGLSETEVSIRNIRKAIAPDLKTNSSTWRNGRDYAVSNLIGWEQRGQSLIRCT